LLKHVVFLQQHYEANMWAWVWAYEQEWIFLEYSNDMDIICRNPTLAKCRGESSETPECLGFDNKAQNTSHWGVIGVIEKVLKRRYRKWPRIGHLNICRPSYGQKKGLESNSRPLKFGNRPLPNLRTESATWRWKDLNKGYKFGSDLIAIRPGSRELWAPKVPGLHPG
jgi:hypothetical protein